MFIYSVKLKLRHILCFIVTILIIIGSVYVFTHPAKEVFVPAEMVRRLT